MRILNVGCGNDTYGTDFIDLYPSRPEVIKFDIEEAELPFEQETFDEVYAKNLLEHLGNPLSALRKMAKVLKKKGMIVIITDNAGYWHFHMPWSNFHHGCLGKASHGQEDMHFMLFTKQHLTNLFHRLGFGAVTIDEWNDDTAWWERPFNWLLKHTWLYRRMSYQKIKVVGFK